MPLLKETNDPKSPLRRGHSLLPPLKSQLSQSFPLNVFLLCPSPPFPAPVLLFKSVFFFNVLSFKRKLQFRLKMQPLVKSGVRIDRICTSKVPPVWKGAGHSQLRILKVHAGCQGPEGAQVIEIKANPPGLQ